MTNNTISVAEALKRIQQGASLSGCTVDFQDARLKALDAFQLGKAGIDVPEEVIVYDDHDIAYDPEFDDYEWQRTDEDPYSMLSEKLTVQLVVEKEISDWIKEHHIDLDHLLQKLIHDFYSSHKIIEEQEK